MKGTRSVECVINRSTSASPTHLFFRLFSCNSKNKFKVGYYLALFPSCPTPSPFYSPDFSRLLFFLWALSNPQVKTANFGLRDCKYDALTHPPSVSLRSAVGQMSQVTPAAEAEPSGLKPSHTCNWLELQTLHTTFILWNFSSSQLQQPRRLPWQRKLFSLSEGWLTTTVWSK